MGLPGHEKVWKAGHLGPGQQTGWAVRRKTVPRAGLRHCWALWTWPMAAPCQGLMSILEFAGRLMWSIEGLGRRGAEPTLSPALPVEERAVGLGHLLFLGVWESLGGPGSPGTLSICLMDRLGTGTGHGVCAGGRASRVTHTGGRNTENSQSLASLNTSVTNTDNNGRGGGGMWSGLG